MELWALFLVLGISCLLVGIVVFLNTATVKSEQLSQFIQPCDDPQTSEEVAMLPNVVLPAQWDEPAITRQLQQLRDQRPAVIPHFVQSVKERWILRQDDRTAEVRLRFLKTQIEQL